MLGNSPSALQNTLHELHSEEWLRSHLDYLSNCELHRKSLTSLSLVTPDYRQPAPPPPKPQWFLAACVRDVWSRMEELLAAATSTYGSILKIDSMKKICKKLQGADTGTAAWTTNVGNERREILQSMLTTSESLELLKMLADGLVHRYIQAQQPAPKILYTDRDCCSAWFHEPFDGWPNLCVRLDVWHFMRRLALGCSTEAHPPYATFMASISNAIFVWDETDYNRLLLAKKGDLQSAGVSNPSDSAAKKAITREELACHYRRRTRGVDETQQLIEELLLSLFC